MPAATHHGDEYRRAVNLPRDVRLGGRADRALVAPDGRPTILTSRQAHASSWLVVDRPEHAAPHTRFESRISFPPRTVLAPSCVQHDKSPLPRHVKTHQDSIRSLLEELREGSQPMV